jgi:exonuclease VII large subunit
VLLQLSQVTGRVHPAHHMSLAAVAAPSAAAEHLTPNERLRQKLLQRVQKIESHMEERLHEA